MLATGVLTMQDIAKEGLGIARAGLAARARAQGFDRDETHFLNALHEIADSGVTPAEELLARYRGDWKGDLSRIYAEYSY